jgi:hypothetical protein
LKLDTFAILEQGNVVPSHNFTNFPRETGYAKYWHEQYETKQEKVSVYFVMVYIVSLKLFTVIIYSSNILNETKQNLVE